MSWLLLTFYLAIAGLAAASFTERADGSSASGAFAERTHPCAPLSVHRAVLGGPAVLQGLPFQGGYASDPPSMRFERACSGPRVWGDRRSATRLTPTWLRVPRLPPADPDDPPLA